MNFDMKNINEMTPKELRDLADKIEAKEKEKIYKIGYLKKDKYFCDLSFSYNGIDIMSELTLEQINHIIIPNIKNAFKLAIPANTKFTATSSPYANSPFLWTAIIDGNNIMRCDDWAYNNLINITDV